MEAEAPPDPSAAAAEEGEEDDEHQEAADAAEPGPGGGGGGARRVVQRRGKPKDPNAPPKPLNPFQRVTAEARQRLKEARPELASDLKAMSGALKGEWEKVPQEEKDKLQEAYERDMAVWRPKFEAYKQTPGYKQFAERKQDWIDRKQQKGLAKRHAKTAPKRPRSGYMLFAGEVRERVAEEVAKAGGGLADIGKRISEEWSRLSDEKKTEYNAQSAKLKATYEVEFAEYKLSENYKEFMDEKAKLESQQQQKKLIRTRLADAPKRPLGSFGLFRQEAFSSIVAENKGCDKAELARKLAAAWHALPDEKRASYRAQAEERKADYGRQMAEFRKKGQYTSYLKDRFKVKLKENRRLNLRDAPKKPKSLLALFIAKHRSELAGAGPAAAKRRLDEAPEAERKALEEEHASLMAKYEEALTAWKESNRYKEFEKREAAAKKELTKEAMQLMTVKFLSAAPAQPPKSAFAIFVGEKRKATVQAGAEGDGDEQGRAKASKRDEVARFKEEWEKLDKEAVTGYEAAFKKRWTEWQAEVKAFMAQDTWKEYVAEAKELKLPIKNFLQQKATALKQFGSRAGAAGGASATSSSPAVVQRPKSMPARPPDAYKVFCKERAAGAGGAGGAEGLSKAWQELDAEGKAKYVEEAGRLQKQYEEAMAAFRESEEGKAYYRDVGKALRLKKVRIARSTYLKEMPKPPPGAMKAFVDKVAAELKAASAELKAPEARRQAEERWKALDEAERAKLEAAAAEAHHSYQAKLGEFKKSTAFAKFARAAGTGRRLGARGSGGARRGGGVAKRRSAAGAPPAKPEGEPTKPLDAFREFCKEMKGAAGRGREVLQQAFEALPQADREARQKKAKEAEEKYTKDLAAFRKTKEWRAYERRLTVHQKRQKLADAKAKFCAEAPKKPPGAAQLFAAARRAEVMKAHPELKGPGPVISKLMELWRGLSEAEQAPWLEKEKASLEEHRKALEAYHATDDYKAYMKVVGRVQQRPGAKAKAKAATAKAKAAAKGPEEPSGLPKRPPASPLAVFVKANTGKGLTMRTAGEAWSKLGADGQKEYIDKLRARQAEYAKELAEFKKTPEGKKYFRAKEQSEKKAKEAKVKEKFLGGESAPKEPKRPASAYFMFVAERRGAVAKELGSGNAKQVASKLTELWGGLSAEDKKVFEDRAAKQKEEYDKAMVEYRSSEGYKKYSRALVTMEKRASKKAKKDCGGRTSRRSSGASAGRGAGGRGSAAGGRGRGDGGRGQGVRGRGAAAELFGAGDSDDLLGGSDSSSDLSSSDDDSE